MQTKKIEKLKKQLAAAKAQLQRVGPMRPGTLSQQYKDPKAKTGAYWQLSYTYQMKSRTKYVRPEEVKYVGTLVANFKRFRRLCERCVDLSLRLADLRIELNRSAPHHQD